MVRSGFEPDSRAINGEFGIGEIAEARPMLKKLKPSLTASSISVVVASPGPPAVVTKTISKTRKASMVRSVSASRIAGNSVSKVIRMRTWKVSE